MVMKPDGVRELGHLNFPSFLRQRYNVQQIDLWITGRQMKYEAKDGNETLGEPYTPKTKNAEYQDLANRTPDPWGGLVVASLAQTAYVDGIRTPKVTKGNLKVWNTFQRNRWDAKQIPLHRAAIGHGLAFGLGLPGKDPVSGDRMTKLRAVSAKRMAAFYDVEDDEWPRFAFEAEPWEAKNSLGMVESGWHVTLYDEDAIHYLEVRGSGEELRDWQYVSYETHPAGVPPVVRFVNQMDLDGNAMGEIESVIPLLSRVDQSTFDRLIVQRYGAWKIRYIAGMAKPETDEEKRAAALHLRVEDLLVSPDTQTKFGTLEATELKGFIEAKDADLRVLSAIKQIPPHHLLGLSSNLQAEALAAAEAGLQRKSGDFRTVTGEGHEQLARLAAHLDGNREEATAFDMEVRWRDTESRSLVQAANAMGIMATNLKVPVEMLWERLPGWTDQDTERAKKLVQSGEFERLIAALEGQDPNAAKPKATGGSDNEPA